MTLDGRMLMSQFTEQGHAIQSGQGYRGVAIDRIGVTLRIAWSCAEV